MQWINRIVETTKPATNIRQNTVAVNIRAVSSILKLSSKNTPITLERLFPRNAERADVAPSKIPAAARKVVAQNLGAVIN